MRWRGADIYLRSSPFLWAVGLSVFGALASIHPSAPVAWGGVILFVSMALGAAARGLSVRRGSADALRRPLSPLARGLALSGAYVLFPAWLAAMSAFAPAEPMVRWVGAGFFGFVSIAGAVVSLLQPNETARALVERLHDPLHLGVGNGERTQVNRGDADERF